MAKIVLISGKSMSGKDTLANLLKEYLENQGEHVFIIHFADTLKFFCQKYFDWNGEKDEAGRQLLQTEGAKMRRGYIHYWSDIVSKFIDVQSLYFEDAYFIIPDWRYYDEFISVHYYCGDPDNRLYTIRINRVDEDGNVYVNPNMTQEQLLDSSEIDLDNFKMFDCKITNYSLEQLKEDIPIIIECIENGEKLTIV